MLHGIFVALIESSALHSTHEFPVKIWTTKMHTNGSRAQEEPIDQIFCIYAICEYAICLLLAKYVENMQYAECCQICEMCCNHMIAKTGILIRAVLPGHFHS
jgi:hypothetical protein